MDRRDFLKLFALSAAGLYVPRTSYFFMPQTEMRTFEMVIPTHSMEAVWHPEDGRFIEQSRYEQLTVKMIVDLKTHLVKSYSVPHQIMGHVTESDLARVMKKRMAWIDEIS